MTQNDLMIRKNRVQIKHYERVYQQKLRAKKKEQNAKKNGRLSYKQGMDFTNVKTEDLLSQTSEKKSLNSELLKNDLLAESDTGENENQNENQKSGPQTIKKIDTLEIPE